MGADQVGLLLKGPMTIDRVMFNTAVTAGMEFVKTARRALRKRPDATALKVMEDRNLDIDYEVPDIADTCTADIRKMVEGVYGMWDESIVCRDLAWRTDPDDQNTRILFVGEMTHGDDASGLGYEILRDALKYNFASALGIR